jgi:hypothetical protein
MLHIWMPDGPLSSRCHCLTKKVRQPNGTLAYWLPGAKEPLTTEPKCTARRAKGVTTPRERRD